MPLDPESLQRLAASDRLVGKLVANGWPLTKAAYLHLLLYPMDNVQFPLSGDYLEQIPMGLEGPIPVTLQELWDALNAPAASAKQARQLKATHSARVVWFPVGTAPRSAQQVLAAGRL